MPYTEIINTCPGQGPDIYALCDEAACSDGFGRTFGIPDMGALPVTVGRDTYRAERIFEDSSTHHARCFVCGVTVWRGPDADL